MQMLLVMLYLCGCMYVLCARFYIGVCLWMLDVVFVWFLCTCLIFHAYLFLVVVLACVYVSFVWWVTYVDK